MGLVLVPLLSLPIAIPSDWTPPATDNPIPWLLALLGVTVGLPFFVVSTSSPLLQRWFAGTGHPAAGGVLGGVFNALVAPLVFATVVEYPLTLVLAYLLAPGARGGARRSCATSRSRSSPER